jgi:hypothetical protein
MVTVLPAEVIELLGDRGSGSTEPMFGLVTVDAAGVPWPCYLSRRELLADAQTVCVAVRSRRARSNLERTGRATLVVIGARTAYACRLIATTVTTTPGGVVLAALRVESVDEDGVGTPLVAPAFVASDELIRREGADDHTRILARFAEDQGLRPTTTAKRHGAREVATQ